MRRLNSALMRMVSSTLMSGCGFPQPPCSPPSSMPWSSTISHVCFVEARCMILRRRCCGLAIRIAARKRGSDLSTSSLEQLKHTQRMIFITVLMCPTWYTGEPSTWCPKCPGH